MSKTVQDILNDYRNGSVDDISTADNTSIVDNIDIIADNVEKVDGFEIIFNPPTIIDGRLIFSATITSKTGIMFNGSMKVLVSVENEDASTVKSILETIKADTIAAMNQLAANKDWYK